ncbi:hypothetical protein J2S62_002184 [Enteractinococcus fodinae]|uniref:Uncharacterized protein n=1 Tax=Enteractinococcus fodinae TaxID=684663 RepID=A0ABU2B2T0_9MICC|nr:hypothetical protein [Enteractinococcus fodinae]
MLRNVNSTKSSAPKTSNSERTSHLQAAYDSKYSKTAGVIALIATNHLAIGELFFVSCGVHAVRLCPGLAPVFSRGEAQERETMY